MNRKQRWTIKAQNCSVTCPVRRRCNLAHRVRMCINNTKPTFLIRAESGAPSNQTILVERLTTAVGRGGGGGGSFEFTVTTSLCPHGDKK
jgi:hypothetical protein